MDRNWPSSSATVVSNQTSFFRATTSCHIRIELKCPRAFGWTGGSTFCLLLDGDELSLRQYDGGQWPAVSGAGVDADFFGQVERPPHPLGEVEAAEPVGLVLRRMPE